MKVDKHVEKLQLKFVGVLDWIKLRELLVHKMLECQTEQEFSIVIRNLIGSMFTSSKEMNEARKVIGAELISGIEKRKMDKWVRGK